MWVHGDGVRAQSIKAMQETCGAGAEASASIANLDMHETVDDSHEASLTAGGTEAAATATSEREMHETAVVEPSQQAAVVGIHMHAAPKLEMQETAAVVPSQQAAVVGIHMHAAPKRGLSDATIDGTRRVRLRIKTKQLRGFS